jgi:hypothetical protein
MVVTDGVLSYDTRTSDAAYCACSYSSATTRATGCPA